jgi:hypothetical protein
MDPDGFNSLKNPKSYFIYKNLIPIPNLLTKTYLESTEKDPISIGSAFFEAMVSYDEALELSESEDYIQRNTEDSDTLVTDSPTDKDNDNSTSTTRNPKKTIRRLTQDS